MSLIKEHHANTPRHPHLGYPKAAAASGGRAGERFTLMGEVSPGQKTPFSIRGEDFVITAETWVIGKVTVGVVARVSGVVIPRIGRSASKIEVISPKKSAP